MNINRIKGILTQELFITIRSYEVIIDIIVSPILSIILFGFLAQYLTGSSNLSTGNSFLAGVVLWNIVFIIQYSVSVGSLWNIWSRNLSNMFITPASLSEYILSYVLSGTIKSIIIFFLSSIILYFLFQFNIFQINLLHLAIYIINLIFFAISLGMILLGLIFRLGTRIQAFAWGVLPVFQALSAVFYPVSILPGPIQVICRLLPTTYVFESLRESVYNPGVIIWEYVGISFVLNIFYFSFSCFFFRYMTKESKRTGQFVKLEG